MFWIIQFFSLAVFSVCFWSKLYVGCGGIHSTQQDDVVSHTRTHRYERNHKVDIDLTWVLYRHIGICYMLYMVGAQNMKIKEKFENQI